MDIAIARSKKAEDKVRASVESQHQRPLQLPLDLSSTSVVERKDSILLDIRRPELIAILRQED